MKIQSEAGSTPFPLRNGERFVEDLPLAGIYRAVGPCYVYSQAAVERRVAAVQAAFEGRASLIAYAVKANPNHALLEYLCGRGLGAEAVSEAEIDAARRAGFPGARVVCNGNGKSVRDLDAALAAEVRCINLDGAWELPRLEAAAARAGRTFRVLLRVNPDLDPNTHPYIATGIKSSKFGMDFDEAAQVAQAASRHPHLALVGLHVHLGSQIADPAPLREAFQRVRTFGLSLEREHAFRFEVLNLGGGFGVDYTGEAADLDVAALADLLEAPEFWPGRELIIEPGRFLVADAGVLLGQVLGIKGSHGHRFVVVELGMNDLIRPALYQAYHAVEPVRPREGHRTAADVVGPICESGDFLARGREMPVLESGDLICVRHAGAYGASMASNYNGRLRLPEVWVDGSNAWITRRGETLEDLARLDCRQPIRP